MCNQVILGPTECETADVARSGGTSDKLRNLGGSYERDGCHLRMLAESSDGWHGCHFFQDAGIPLEVPCTKLTTPAGNPASCIKSITRDMVIGTFSDGFTISVLPQAMAIGSVQNGTMNGKSAQSR